MALIRVSFDMERTLHRQYLLVHRLRNMRLSWLNRNHLSVKFSLYTVVGAVAFSIDYSIFLTVFSLSGRPYIANILGICAGIAVSFTLNSRYNFRRRDAVIKRAVKFIGVALFGMALSSAIIALLIRQSFDPRLAKVVAMLVVFTAQFGLNALWTFR